MRRKCQGLRVRVFHAEGFTSLDVSAMGRFKEQDVAS